MEDRVPKLLEKLLVKPSLVHPPPMGEGGLLLVSLLNSHLCLYKVGGKMDWLGGFSNGSKHVLYS